MHLYDSTYFDRDICKPFFFAGSRTGILLIHGFTGCVAHMRPLGEAMHGKGFTVKGVNLPGHATTEEDMAQTGWREWLGAAREAAAELRKTCDTVIVCGLSMGGVIALLLAEEGAADACIALSTPMSTLQSMMDLAGVFALIQPRMAWRNREQRHEKLNKEYDYGYSGFPTRKASDLAHLIRMARRGLPSIACPILIVQSRKDETIWGGSMERIARSVVAADKQTLWLQQAPHVCTLSEELPTVVAAMEALCSRMTGKAGTVG